MNFAATVDGRATIGGVSGPIGSETDTAMLVGLRSRFDAVMIGAGTMRAERYAGLVGKRRRGGGGAGGGGGAARARGGEWGGGEARPGGLRAQRDARGGGGGGGGGGGRPRGGLFPKAG